jgi:probable F420-dependent oxidoreductase
VGRGRQPDKPGEVDAVHIGVMLLLTDESASPFAIAKALEDRGFESMFIGEHTHMPAEPHTPYPGEKGQLPPGVNRTYDPFTALMAAATATSRLRLGTSICELAVYDPILLAKVIASVDRLSGGRLILGFGYGWNVQELENHGIAFRERRAILHENIEAMTSIWTNDVASYDGKFVSFDKIWCWPKPVQTPRPPVLLGATGPKGLAAAVEYADGWMPTGYDNFVNGVPLLRDACQAFGRPIETVPITVTDRHVDKERADFYADNGADRLIVSKVMTQFVLENLDAELDAIAGEVSAYLHP